MKYHLPAEYTNRQEGTQFRNVNCRIIYTQYLFTIVVKCEGVCMCVVCLCVCVCVCVCVGGGGGGGGGGKFDTGAVVDWCVW